VIFFFSPSSLFPRVRPVATVNASSSSTEGIRSPTRLYPLLLLLLTCRVCLCVRVCVIRNRCSTSTTATLLKRPAPKIYRGLVPNIKPTLLLSHLFFGPLGLIEEFPPQCHSTRDVHYDDIRATRSLSSALSPPLQDQGLVKQ
jgi:hypothetical protein